MPRADRQLVGSGDSPATNVRVCLAALRFYPVIAGPAMRFQRYAPGLRRRGIDLHVFTCWEPAPGEAFDPAVAQNGGVRSIDEVDGIDVYRAGVPYRKSARVWSDYGALLVRHCHDPRTRPAAIQFLALNAWSMPALLRLRRAGIPLVFTQTMVRAAPGSRLARTVKDALWRAPLQLMDRIVVSSGAMRDELLARGLRPSIDVIPNGVDLA
ncbi:MAG: glycosyltransferase, partial [Longimicrobiales bacterium]